MYLMHPPAPDTCSSPALENNQMGVSVQAIFKPFSPEPHNAIFCSSRVSNAPGSATGPLHEQAGNQIASCTDSDLLFLCALCQSVRSKSSNRVMPYESYEGKSSSPKMYSSSLSSAVSGKSPFFFRYSMDWVMAASFSFSGKSPFSLSVLITDLAIFFVPEM